LGQDTIAGNHEVIIDRAWFLKLVTDQFLNIVKQGLSI
jgi:hypothetical protein